jgi:D-galactosaminyltransferase
VSLDKSRSWTKIYDNSEARIYQWRGPQPAEN